MRAGPAAVAGSGVATGPVVVTGAGGFVGSEVCVALLRAGREVVALDRAFDAEARARLGAAAASGRGLRLVEGDLVATLAGLRGVAPAAVVHGAAITAPPEALGLSRAAHLRRNLDLHLAALDWARSSGAARFLFLSSMGVFAPGDGPLRDGRMTEATTPTADCAYCVAKRLGETLTQAASEAGFATLSLRLGNVCGPHEAVRESRQVLCLLSRMRAEAEASGVITVATPGALRDWAWLPDLARGIAALAERFPDAPMLHAGTPPATTDLDLARGIAARRGDTLIRLGPQPAALPRPPMGSTVASLFDAMPWTGIDAILDRMMPAPVAP